MGTRGRHWPSSCATSSPSPRAARTAPCCTRSRHSCPSTALNRSPSDIATVIALGGLRRGSASCPAGRPPPAPPPALAPLSPEYRPEPLAFGHRNGHRPRRAPARLRLVPRGPAALRNGTHDRG